ASIDIGWLSFFFSSRRRHTRFSRDWSSDVCSSDLGTNLRAQGVTMIGFDVAGLVLDFKRNRYLIFGGKFLFADYRCRRIRTTDKIGRASCRERVDLTTLLALFNRYDGIGSRRMRVS